MSCSTELAIIKDFISSNLFLTCSSGMNLSKAYPKPRSLNSASMFMKDINAKKRPYSATVNFLARKNLNKYADSADIIDNKKNIVVFCIALLPYSVIVRSGLVNYINFLYVKNYLL